MAVNEPLSGEGSGQWRDDGQHGGSVGVRADLEGTGGQHTLRPLFH